MKHKGLELKPEVVKKLEAWQLYTLVNNDEVLTVFLNGLEYGNPDTGEYFKSPVRAFFQALRMCGYHYDKLRVAYERIKRRESSTNPGTAESRSEGQGEN